MIIRMMTVVFALTLASMAAGETATPTLCTITGTVATPPSPPSLSKGLSHLADTMMIINVPVPACTVWALTIISSRQFFGITDNAGRYRIDSVPVFAGVDSVTIVAEKNGYATLSHNVYVIGNGTVTADLTLQKSSVVNIRVAGSEGNPAEKTRIYLTNSGKSILININGSRIRWVSAYSLDGRIIGRLAGTELLSGARSHAVLCGTGMRTGVVIVRVVGDGLLVTKAINFQNMR